MTPRSTESGLHAGDPHERAAAAAALGLASAEESGADGRDAAVPALVSLATDDPSVLVRCAALGALARLDPTGHAARTAWNHATADPDAAVRRRATETAPAVAAGSVSEARVLLALVDDDEVAEGAAWALGELADTAVEAGAVTRLADAAVGHDDPLVRESAVAALGALGHPDGLEAILAGCRDKPTVRRRAVLALAPFDGDAVDAALAAALSDRDWQVRQAAEDLSGGKDGAARDDRDRPA